MKARCVPKPSASSTAKRLLPDRTPPPITVSVPSWPRALSRPPDGALPEADSSLFESRFAANCGAKCWGEEVLAWVKFKCDHQATEEELKEFCRQALAHFKTPRYWKFVDCFPTTVTGKIQKFKIREEAIKDLGLHDVASIETA